MTNERRKIRPVQDVIAELWEECRSKFAGESELIQIQKVLEDSFGIIESPASIARTLADHQVPLRHPEILEADSRWRAIRLSQFPDVRAFGFESIETAIESMGSLEEWRKRSHEVGDLDRIEIIFEQARELKMELARQPNELNLEIIQWLNIWLQNPQIFDDWLELRRKSKEFQQRFLSDPG